jgi:DNA-binding SARP family transcriptional activator
MRARTATRLRGLTAAILLLAAVIGLPTALAGTVGDPLQSWPSLMGGQLSDTDVIAILAAVFWLAWLSFVIPAMLEMILAIRTRITHRPARHIRIPLLGGQQDLARHLIAAVLLLLPAHSAAGSAPLVRGHPATNVAISTAAWTVPATPRSAHHNGDHRTRATGRERSYVIPDVGGMRSYWALAEHYLGDGTRWREIWHLNQGRTHADGTVVDTPSQLHAGWTILIPSADNTDSATGHDHGGDGPTTQVTVADGDTLSGIAAQQGVSDWQQLWDANADRAEPHGQRLTDPDLIYPGWTLDLPTSSPRPGREPGPSNGTSAHPPAAGHHPDRQTSPPDNGTRGVPEGQSAPTPATPPATKPPTTHDPIAPSASSAPAPIRAPQGHDQHLHTGHRLPVVPLEIGLAAAAAVAALDRARRIAQRRRRVGHRPLPPPAPLRRVEADLRYAARVTHPAVAAVELATALTATSPTAVDISFVTARDDGAVDLHLGPPNSDVPPPPPFVAIPGGWRLPAEATGFSFAVDSVDERVPALTPIGRTSDGQVLVDLAHHGPVSIAGDPDTVTQFLTQLAVALLATPWSGRVFLTVPATLRDQLGEQEHVTIENGPPALPSVVPSAVTGAEEPGWCTTPIYLYLGWSAADPVDGLLQTAADPTTGVHAILNGAHHETSVWTLDGDRLTIPGIDEPVTVTLPEPDQPDASDLIAFTRSAEQAPVGDPRLPDHTLDAPPHRATTSRQLNLLGPVELAGVDTPRRTQILNLLTYLALHRRGADHDTLDTVLWKKQVGGKTLRNRMHEARRLVDGAITDGPIWRLTDEVTTDWQRFTALAAGTPAEQREALRLVRGRPFEGLDYADWLDLEGARSEVEATVVDLALTVAERELDAGDPDAAYLAARAGLDASRYEERLHRLAIRAAKAAGHTSIVDTLKAEMRTAIEDDIEPDGALEPETLDLYARVRRGRAATGR